MPGFYFDPAYLIWIAPAMLLAMWAQWRVHSAFAAASREPAALTGAAAARFILDSAGARDVEIEAVPGQLNDHYDPQAKVLRLSQGVYGERSLAAVGIAAHEAGHALQDAQGYSLMAVRNAAVGTANLGSGLGFFVFMIGLGLALKRKTTGFVDTDLDLLGQGAEMRIARCQFAEGVANADDRAAIELVMRHALALDPAAVGKSISVLAAEPLLAAKFFGFFSRGRCCH